MNLMQCIPCGQYILVDRFLRNSDYLFEHEVLLTFACQFPAKRSFEKSKNTEVSLTLTGPGGGSEAQMPKIEVNIN